MKRGMNRDNQKRLNRGLVLRLIATGQCSSRTDLAERMGLTKAAISQITAGLLADGFLQETTRTNTEERGRNPVGICIAKTAPKFAGFLMQRNFCEAVICDMQLNILDRHRIECRVWENNEKLIEEMYASLDEVLERHNVCAIGVGCIGPLDIKAGKILEPFYCGIKNLEIRKLLEERYHLPVIVDHDNQSAALAEYLYGAARECQDVLLISANQGVGCGILVDGERVHSFSGYSPEIGHIPVETDGLECICGNRGCLERYVNSDRMMIEFFETTGEIMPYWEFSKMSARSEIDDIFRKAVRRLDSAIISTINIMNSQVVILGGDLCWWPERYLRMMEDEINSKKC